MIVLDTHAWVWWSAAPERLSRPARAAIEREAGGGAALVSAISCWEVAKLVEKGRLVLSMEVGEWIDLAIRLPPVRLAALEPRISVLSTRLPGSPPRDPADQIILATALQHKAPLVTKDDRMRACKEAVTIW